MTEANVEPVAEAPQAADTKTHNPILIGAMPLEDSMRRRFFITSPPKGTNRHNVVHCDFWRAQQQVLQRHDAVTILVESDGGEPQSYEIEMRVERVHPDVKVKVVKSSMREPLDVDIVRLDDGGYIQWVAGGTGRDVSAYTVFSPKGVATTMTGHQTVAAARAQWAREMPKKA